MRIGELIVSSAVLAEVALAQIRGVSPDDQHKYQPDAENKWHCIGNPEIVLDISQINDNFCDCPDGSDEPGTSLCYNGRFFCANKGHIAHYVPSFLVDDGVCDYELCCDGSDEQGTVDCPDRCAELNAIHAKEQLEREAVLREGLKKKSQLLKLVEEEKRKISKEVEGLKRKLSESEKTLLVLEENYDESREHEASLSALSKVLPSLDAIKQRFLSQKAHSNQLSLQLAQLEAILEKMSKEYNPNFNDLAVKEAIKNFQDYIVNKEEVAEKSNGDDEAEVLVSPIVEQLKEIDATTLSAVPEISICETGVFQSIVGQVKSSLYSFIGVEPDVDLNPCSKSATFQGGSQEIKDLKLEIESLEKQIEAKLQELNSDQYGPQEILRSYKDKCLVKKFGEYEYKYCFTGNINQQGNGHSVLLGRFSSIKETGDSDHLQLIYERGDKCWSGPIRKGIIDIECGAEDELVSVLEPEVCLYYLKVKSPIACNGEIKAEDPEDLRDEL